MATDYPGLGMEITFDEFGRASCGVAETLTRLHMATHAYLCCTYRNVGILLWPRLLGRGDEPGAAETSRGAVRSRDSGRSAYVSVLCTHTSVYSRPEFDGPID